MTRKQAVEAVRARQAAAQGLARQRGRRIMDLAERLYVEGRSTVQSCFGDAEAFIVRAEQFEQAWAERHSIGSDDLDCVEFYEPRASPDT